MSNPKNRQVVALLCGAVLSAAGTGRAAVVHMMPQAKVTGPVVRLADIATCIAGSDRKADQLGRIVVLRHAQGAVRVTAAQAMFAVAAAGQTALLSRLRVDGADSCLVRAPGPKVAVKLVHPVQATLWANAPVAVAVAPVPAAKKPVAAAGVGAKGAAKKMAGATGAASALAALLRTRILHRLHAKPADVRMEFQTLNPLLDQQLAAGQRWRYQRITGQYLGLVEFRAQEMRQGQLLQEMYVTVHVKQRVHTLVSTVLIRRNQVVSKADFALKPRWIDRKLSTLCSDAAALAGQQAIRAIPPGQMLDQRDFKPVDLVHQGETVTVYFKSGAMQVKSLATADKAGRLHSIIGLTSATGEKFDAVVTGRDVAVVGAGTRQGALP